MTFGKQSVRLILIALIGLFLTPLISACDDVRPTLAATPTPSASPTPLPDAFSVEITAEPVPTDQLGNALRGEDHYNQYLSFGDIRVYQYREGTFLDGVCVNAYPLALDGQINIVYYTEDTGKLCGIGTIHNASGGTRLETGANTIYAEIETDIDVRMMDFQIEYIQPYQPVSPEETPHPAQ